MKRRTASISFAAGLVAIVAVSFISSPRSLSKNPQLRSGTPLIFEANNGQSDKRVKFLSRGNGYTMFLTAAETVLSVRNAVVRVKLLGANPAVEVKGNEELPGTSNYFIGNDPTKWHAGVPHYAKVRYRNVYPGVDLVYYGNQQQIEHDFVVAPGADPRQVRFQVTGAEKVELDGEGDLVLQLADGEIRQRKPTIYQGEGEARMEIAGRYTLTGANDVGFEFGPYDAARPLVIDPILMYSTYLGGSGTDRGLAPAVDRNGNVYVTGQTNSTNFPVANPLQAAPGNGLDVFVTKLNPSGSAVVYSTYIGGNGDDSGLGIAVDEEGSAYVSGWTASTNFPTAGALQSTYGGGARDAFVLKVNAAGSALAYSTYLGGSGQDESFDLRLDETASAYVSGRTSSTNFPTVNPQQPANAGGFDAFVTKLNPTGSALIYSTYLGGSGNEGSAALAVVGGSAYVTADTSSTDFPTANPLQPTYSGGPNDAFVTKLNAAGSSLVYSTYLGGSGLDLALAIAVDPSGNAYVAGRTGSMDFPVANSLQPAFGGGPVDAFVAKLNAAGSSLIYATYLGGSVADNVFGIVADPLGNAYVSGFTSSRDFPTANPLQPAFGGGTTDAFVAKLNAAGGVLVYSTYLGGSGEDRGDYIVLDAAGNAYMTGWTASTDFPTINPAQPAYGGGSFDVFVVKISEILSSGVFYFAQAGGGDGFSTAIALTNPSTTKSVSGSVSFFGPDGRPLDAGVGKFVMPFVIQPSGAAVISTSTQPSFRSAYARISASEPVFANATYLLPGLPALSVRPSITAAGFTAPISRDIPRGDAGIALTNTSDVQARVSLIVMDAGANEFLSSMVVLGPGEQLSRFLSELIPNLPNRFSGTLQIRVLRTPFDRPVVLAATMVELGPGQLREVPLTAFQ